MRAAGKATKMEKCLLGLTAAFSINRLPQTLQDSAPHAAQNLAFTMENILRLLEAAL